MNQLLSREPIRFGGEQSPRPEASTSSSQPLTHDPRVIARVLAHRTDADATTFIDKQTKAQAGERARRDAHGTT